MIEALTYAAAGVDIQAAEVNVRRIGAHVRSTHGPSVLGSFGAFAGLYHLTGLKDPVLVASTDGVGSKLELAHKLAQHEGIGRDLVNLSVNDILTAGARPLFFLDYIALHSMEHDQVEALVRGMSAACRENECALLGGETAQLPDLYQPGQYDLAGFVVGVVEREQIVDGSRVQLGDAVWALPSTGLHTNGFTLARRVIATAELDLRQPRDDLGGQSLGEALLAAHPSYLAAMRPLLAAGAVKAMAHITGGGLAGNLPRVLPAAMGADVAWGAWPVPPVFEVLRRAGGIAHEEMLRVFNMGLGFVFVVEPGVDCPGALRIGTIVPSSGDGERVVVTGAPRD
ncbi:MAG: phosphoribosylformylglycinamidine cyclo-ligase [Chloroflexi bacterium]|nr:phosphoribosylformylglycinamidine cyclo-ligase [Chloroflexota bacterium]